MDTLSPLEFFEHIYDNERRRTDATIITRIRERTGDYGILRDDPLAKPFSEKELADRRQMFAPKSLADLKNLLK